MKVTQPGSDLFFFPHVARLIQSLCFLCLTHHGNVITSSTVFHLPSTVSQGRQWVGGHKQLFILQSPPFVAWFGAWGQITILLKWLQAVSMTFSVMAYLSCRWRRQKHREILGEARKTAAQFPDEARHLVAVCTALPFHSSAFNVIQLKIVLQGQCCCGISLLFSTEDSCSGA